MNLRVILVLFEIFNTQPDSIIRGIYINPYQASKKEYLERIFVKADSGLINALIVDLKSDYGFLAYASDNDIAREMGAIKRYVDIDYIIKQAKIHKIKVIARVVCFLDNYLAYHEDYGICDDSGKVWIDKNELAWTNPYHQDVRNYLVQVVKEITSHGISSIAFDYIRFPTDGAVGRIRLSKVDGPRYKPILKFLQEVQTEVGDKIEIGVCVFGFSVWHPLKSEGQVIEKMGDHIDVLYPMLYPSHFGWNFKRQQSEYWRNYWIYFDSVKEAKKKLPARIQVLPFIQGFDLYTESFNAEYVSAQISGALTAGADGFMIWHAGGNYFTSWPSLLWARNSVLRKSALMSLSNHMREVGQRYPDIDLAQLQAQAQNRMKNLTTVQTHTRIDIQPSARSRKFYLDPIVP